jgi:hypothetical protein
VRYLVDTSALVRLQRRQAQPEWDGLVERGLVTVCEPALIEALKIAETKEYSAAEQQICSLYVWAAVPDNIWSMTAAIRRELVPHGVHQGLSVADLVVAATAIRLKLEVLHEDGDFETVARFVPELRQRRISAGPA